MLKQARVGQSEMKAWEQALRDQGYVQGEGAASDCWEKLDADDT
jgi:hypothetical protein